jgi:hypothetical protein
MILSYFSIDVLSTVSLGELKWFSLIQIVLALTLIMKKSFFFIFLDSINCACVRHYLCVVAKQVKSDLVIEVSS